MDDQTAIRTLIQDRTTAMRTGDAETICFSYAPDAVVFSLAPPLVQPPDGPRDIAKLKNSVTYDVLTNWRLRLRRKAVNGSHHTPPPQPNN